MSMSSLLASVVEFVAGGRSPRSSGEEVDTSRRPVIVLVEPEFAGQVRDALSPHSTLVEPAIEACRCVARP